MIPNFQILKKHLRIIEIILFIFVLARVHWSELLEVLSRIDVKLFLFAVFLIIPLVSLIVALPISVLGVGTREINYIFLLSFVNINLNEAVVFSLLILFWRVLSGVPGLILNTYQKRYLKI